MYTLRIFNKIIERTTSSKIDNIKILAQIREIAATSRTEN